jgi:hypothetical protein
LAGAGAAAAALTSLAVVLARSGLDTADKLASVLGLFVGVAGLALTVASIVRRQGSGRRSGTEPARQGQTVSDSLIGGDNIQIGSARDVRIHRRS